VTLDDSLQSGCQDEVTSIKIDTEGHEGALRMGDTAFIRRY
jgi:hypothetical protein